MRWSGWMGMMMLVCAPWVGLAAPERGTNASASSGGPQGAAPPLRVEVEPRVELMSLIFRLAGNSEYNRARVQSYADEVEAQFGASREHAVVHLAQELHRSTGVSYDAVMGMAVHMSEPPELGLRVALTPWPESLDERWNASSASNFVTAARAFVTESQFEEFVQRHQPLYATTVSRLKAVLDEHAHLEWFNPYFGERPGAVFTVVPGLLNGGNCYGAHIQPPGCQEELYCILGVWRTDAKGLPQFTEEIVPTVAHEFCHSYANPIIDRHQVQLEPAGAKLFARVAEKMRRQAYGSPLTMLRESLVRACVCRYVWEFQGAEAARKAVAEQQGSGFLWMKELTELLTEYEAQRSTYPTLEAFAPRLVAFFDQYARDLESGRNPAKGAAPEVVKMIPANGATDVDPDLTEIRVTFDRPMTDGSWSMCGGGPNFPELVGRPHYDEGRTNWSVTVKLKPEWDYEFGLNAPSYQNFRSAENVPLEPVLVQFRTRKR